MSLSTMPLKLKNLRSILPSATNITTYDVIHTVIYPILFSELNKVQNFITVFITKYHAIRQTGTLLYLRTAGHDEDKGRILQLSERTLKNRLIKTFHRWSNKQYILPVCVCHRWITQLLSTEFYFAQCTVFCLAYFDTFSKKKETIFGQNIEHKICGLIFYTNLSEIFLIFRRIRRYITIQL
jgi:hypothetical protein